MKAPFFKILPLFALGITAGFLNGLLGAGGGIVIVLGLRLLLGKKLADPRSVFASAIAVMLPLSALSAYRYFGGDLLVNDPKALLLIPPAVVGGVLGAWLLKHISPRLLSRVFAAVVLISGVIMVV